MQTSDLKYLIAYIAPVFCWCGIYFKGWLSPGMFYLAFLIIPAIEPMLSHTKYSKSLEKPERRDLFYFDLLLYLHIPIVYGLLIYYLNTVSTTKLSPFEHLGLVLNMGTILGSMGINIAHELGHRHSKIARIASQMLLLPSLYMHFQIEHNLGHHKNVGTPEDPATALKNEAIYLFWFRSISGSFANAWKLNTQYLKKNALSHLSLENKMLWFMIVQILYLTSIYWIFGLKGFGMAIAAALIAVLLLESVNYIEHYGIQRKKLDNFRYEPVQIHHSWNSNHPLGRIFLFELTRHADHHYKSTRPYQQLRHYEQSPQLPMGYPAAILLSLIPPLWFKLINPFLIRET